VSCFWQEFLTLDLALTLTPPPSDPLAAAPQARAASKKRQCPGE
jgi:hypothetical protein